jgi:dTDP-glucose pyrophosphorylase
MINNILILDGKVGFEEAIKLLDSNGNGAIPVVDNKNKFIGLITDGDIRKAILNKNLDLNHIINKNPYKLNVNSSMTMIKNYLKKINRRQLPLVDDENCYVKMFIFDDLEFKLRENWVIIMAGGLGKRLGELTKDTPKPMLKAGGRPVIEHIIDMFTSHGFSKFALSVNYKSEIIKDHFKDGKEYGVEIRYLEETKRLGTGGALSLIDFPVTEAFFVINGDVLSSLDYEALLTFHLEENSIGTMCIRKDSYQIPYGVIKVDDKKNILDVQEKPLEEFFINTGVYMLNPEVLQFIPKNKFFNLPDLFKILASKEKIIKSFEIVDYWIDIGRASDYDQINKDFDYEKC